MEKEVERFAADDDEGNIYTIVVIQEYVDGGSSGNPNNWIPGMKRLELDDGSAVNVIDADTFRIFDSSMKLRRIR